MTAEITRFTNSYIVRNSQCGFCMNSPIVLPIKLDCNHKCCMSCLTIGKKFGSITKCAICRNDTFIPFRDESPVYHLPSDINIDDFYANFTRGTLVETTIKNDLLGKQVVITKDIDGRPEKDIIFKQTIIGYCVSVSDTEYQLENAFIINRHDMYIYPTFPRLRVYQFNTQDVCHVVDNR